MSKKKEENGNVEQLMNILPVPTIGRGTLMPIPVKQLSHLFRRRKGKKDVKNKVK